MLKDVEKIQQEQEERRLRELRGQSGFRGDLVKLGNGNPNREWAYRIMKKHESGNKQHQTAVLMAQKAIKNDPDRAQEKEREPGEESW